MKWERLFNLRNLVILGAIIFSVGLIQAIIFGYAAWLNTGLFFLEEPMDKMTFGLILMGVSILAARFEKKTKLSKYTLSIFVVVFTIFVRLLWEVLWVTGSYYPSVYTSYSILKQQLPTFAWQGDSKLDYLTDAWNHFTVQFSMFAIFFAALILTLFSMYVEIKKK